MNGRAPSVVNAWPLRLRLDELRGEPLLAEGVSVTPIARRLALSWPGGAWVYAWPSAIEYPEGSRTRRARIIPYQRLVSVVLVALSAGALVAFAAQRWKDGQRNAG